MKKFLLPIVCIFFFNLCAEKLPHTSYPGENHIHGINLETRHLDLAYIINLTKRNLSFLLVVNSAHFNSLIESKGKQIFDLKQNNMKIKNLLFVLADPENNLYVHAYEKDNNLLILIGDPIEFEVKGHSFKFFESNPNSIAGKSIKKEILENSYTPFKDFKCEEGDVIIDIGAHVGMISILYSKLYPEAKIYAFEPMLANFKTMLKNIEINNATNITPVNKAVTSDGRNIEMASYIERNSGGGTQLSIAAHEPDEIVQAESTTLEEIFNQYDIQKCKLLKIDCEGSEYEILYAASDKLLNKIEYMTGEFHENNIIRKNGNSMDDLEKYCQEKNIKVAVTKHPGCDS